MTVQSCFRAVFSDVDGCNALAMVTGELLENAMKYGAWGTGNDALSFRLRVQGDEAGTRVSVQNPVKNEDAIVALNETLAWIDGFDTAEAAYRARLLEIANSDGDPEKSKLGLVRVAYEGDCSLSTSVEDGLLTIVAEFNEAHTV